MVRRPLGNHLDGPDTLLVTPDTTQTERMAEETEKLRELITPARFVLFDFDGPICRLFAGHSAERVAMGLVLGLKKRGLRGLLPEEVWEEEDPMAVMHAVAAQHPGSDLIEEVEGQLTQEEMKATATAWPTPYADPVIQTWVNVGARLAITTNNNAGAVVAYLSSRNLEHCFAPHIYGRTQDLDLLKPNPYCLNRALSAMGADPSAALMIGDAPSDYEAAVRAGVKFLGYARNDRKEGLLRGAGVKREHIVNSLEPVLTLLRGRG
ncbi:HAD hydrolase-like protein [Streptomyces sp. NBC_01381]|uniref:HAD family hydrolase n=1 Tax=Streptomyces sp. NBC_01381 TaxID=2903845 RepID=UPI002251BF39|nr:HAD hydrolase-like protein [Streptomyces sp. NBC_01381]MCX4666100.1 HAD hydrolase-like protein [Streptomyces sp. NBC_01381]